MRREVVRRAFAALLGAGLGACLAAGAVAAEPPAVAEQAVVRLVRLSALFDEQSGGACAALDGTHVEVEEDGRSVGPVYLESGRLPSTHAVLIDVGPSMLGHLDVVRRATAAHVAGLPADEPALLATFDDSLLLQAPLSKDRERFDRSLGWIETGQGQHLWESLSQFVRYLGPIAGRKTLLLLTDGCDSQRTGAVPAKTAIEEVGDTESLVVFAVGVGLPLACPRTDVDPAEDLRDLARASGGEFYALRKEERLDTILAGIRARLDRERVLQYRPAPFGEGPRDAADRQDHRYRRVRLTVRGLPGCKGRLAGPALRLETRSADLLGVGSRLAPAGASFASTGSGAIAAELDDVVQDGGAPPDPLGLPGLQSDRGPELPRRSLTRRVASLVPTLDAVVRPDAGPATAMFNALEAIARPPLGRQAPVLDRAATAWSDVPLLVNGSTLLEQRRALAQALAEQPEFGRWAIRRVLRARLEALDGLVERAATPELRDALATARASLTREPWAAQPDELEAYVGAWLGDVRAPEMFNAAEGWMARRLVEAGSGTRPDLVEPAAAEAEALWRTVGLWFPPAEDVRTLGLLVPGYDAERDVIGYYRVSLKQSTASAINQVFAAADPTHLFRAESDDAEDTLYARLQRWNYSRDAPLGVRLLRWMLEQGQVRPVLGRLSPVSIRYASPSDRDLYPLLKRIGLSAVLGDRLSYPARLVAVTLSDREQPGRKFDVQAYFPARPGETAGYADAPGCLVLPDDLPLSGTGFELYGSLLAAMKRSPSPCFFQAGADAAGDSRSTGG